MQKRIDLSYEVAYHHFASGRYERAARWLRRTSKLCAKHGREAAYCTITERLGDVSVRLAQLSSAEKLFKASIRYEKELRHPDPISVFRRAAKLSQVYFLMGDCDRACSVLIERAIWFKQTYRG